MYSAKQSPLLEKLIQISEVSICSCTLIITIRVLSLAEGSSPCPLKWRGAGYCIFKGIKITIIYTFKNVRISSSQFPLKWWVMAGSVVAGECCRRRGEGEEEEEKKKKKPGACFGCFDFILNLCIFLKMMRYQFMIGGQKNPAMTVWKQHS